MSIRYWRLALASVLLVLMAACLPAVGRVSRTATPPAHGTGAGMARTPAPTLPPPSGQAPVEHRIGVRTVSGAAEFFDRGTGARFVPRGHNLVRLGWQQDAGGAMIKYHSTFNVGLYDAARADDALKTMAASGYNTVRVFIHGACKDACLGNSAGGVSSAYVANLVDFLRRAQQHGIFVIVTIDAEPGTPYYYQLLDTDASEQFQGMNRVFLRRGGILAGSQFWQDLIAELARQKAPFDALLAYELRNEIYFETNQPPLSLTEGIVETANGQHYDMAVPEERQRMMDEGLVFYLDSVRATILEHDPTALVTAAFLVPNAPHVWNNSTRVIRTYPALWQSTLDFIDLHPIAGGLSLQQQAENFELAGFTRAPVVVAEFGASRAAYLTPAQAARGLHDWQVASCAYGFSGWLLWTWDSDERDSPDYAGYYNALSGGGFIRQALAPVTRPDPCQPGDFDFFEVNLAQGKALTASGTLPEQPLPNLVDGLTSSWWGAGGPAPQWIEIDLGAPQTVGRVRLVALQSPSGPTTHELWVGATADALQLLHTFDGYTTDQQTLEFAPLTPLQGVRYLRVVTTRSPATVAWREIEVLAP